MQANQQIAAAIDQVNMHRIRKISDTERGLLNRVCDVDLRRSVVGHDYAFTRRLLNDSIAPQTDPTVDDSAHQILQPVAVRTLVAEHHSYARWRPGVRAAFRVEAN